MNEEKTFNPDDLPQQDIFKHKEIYQHKQPADQGKPASDGNNNPENETGKDMKKTNKEEGLNEAKSTGTAGAFEGFEDRRQID